MKTALIITTILFLIACGEEKNENKITYNPSPIENTEGQEWFSKQLDLIDEKIGKRIQYMQNLSAAYYTYPQGL